MYWIFLMTVCMYAFGWEYRYNIFQRIKKGFLGRHENGIKKN